MSDYYLDLETHSTTRDPDIKKDPIIAISYQQIDSRTGIAKGELQILKSWESSEAEILREFHSIFKPEEKWNFVPIGFNLSFDISSLIWRWREIGIKVDAQNLHVNHPYIDLQQSVILCNRGAFGGASLENFAGKQGSGDMIREWYEGRHFDLVEDYIKDEVASFLKLYQYLVNRLPEVWLEYAKESGIII